MRDPAERFREILERNRAEVAPDLPRELLEEMADVEEQNQFDDDRKPTRNALRASVENALRQLNLEEAKNQ
jgi:hypothetical protein